MSEVRVDGTVVARTHPEYVFEIQEPNQPPRKARFAQAEIRGGAHPDNDLVLQDEAVSRLHFEVEIDSNGFHLRDLDSTNGTYIDGMRVRDGYLRPGARIRVGRCQLRFELMTESVRQTFRRQDAFGPIVGKSTAMRVLFSTLEKVAATEATLLVQGESGTGKELVAEAVHAAGPRSQGPMVVFDCSAIPPNLVESELFGHERGAFTGAEQKRAGVLEEAAGGTVFLDEIGELPLEVQPKLLRALESRKIRPVGSNRMVPLDVRFIAATHRDLAREVNHGTFREDLYYRLAVVRIRIPSLRERTEDIPLLVRALLERLMPHAPERVEQWLDRVSEDRWRRLTSHPWRGNVRELRNMIERAVALSPSHSLELEPSSLGLAESTPVTPAQEVPVDFDRGFREQKQALVEHFERTYLTGILERHDGNISRAAAAAGLDRMYFKRLLARYR